MSALRTFYYLEDYADETIPCLPELQAWADWLSQPDLEWNRPEAVASGTLVKASVWEVIAEVEVTWHAGAWSSAAPVPEATEFVVIDGPGGGWDGELVAETFDEALEYGGNGEEGQVELVAALRWAPQVMARFEVDDGKATLTVIGPVS